MSKSLTFKGKLIASGSNAKTVKGDDVFVTAIMYLSPFTEAGVGNVCAMAETAKCFEGCLNKAGRATMFQTIPEARKRKTRFYMKERAAFLDTLTHDVERFVSWCANKGTRPAVRLNGTSDIMWEKGHPVTRKGVRYASIFEAFPEVQFYDYTKIYTRVDKVLPSNYALTLSYSEANPDFARAVMTRVYEGKANVAVVYRTKALAAEFVRVCGSIDGDETDMRFLDKQPMAGSPGNIVALYAKGPAKKDYSGFVVD